MNSEYLFKMALGISKPWEIVKIDFKPDSQELHLHIDFQRGTRFEDKSGKLCAVHDTAEKTWRHLDFFQHKCYLHCRVPRIITSDETVELVQVPWARSGSGFTLLFEAFAMALIENEMPINKVGKILLEDAHRIWTIFNYWIKRAYNADKPKTPRALGLDETSCKKGHSYVTLAVNLDGSMKISVGNRILAYHIKNRSY